MDKYNTILLNIKNSYDRAEDLYQATRKAWRIGHRRDNLKYALAIHKGKVIEVFNIQKWTPLQKNGRWEFDGEVAAQDIRNKYLGKKYKMYGPIKYL